MFLAASGITMLRKSRYYCKQYTYTHVKVLKNILSFFKKVPLPRKETILLVLVVALLTIIITTSISLLLEKYDNTRIPSLGTIRTIGVEAYGGSLIQLSNGDKTLDWGTIYPGTLTKRSFYLKSQSTVPIILQLSTSNWTLLDVDGENTTDFLKPPDYIPLNESLRITWNYNGTPLSPNEEIYVTLTLNATDSIEFVDYLIDYQIREFSFDIIIVGNET